MRKSLAIMLMTLFIISACAPPMAPTPTPARPLSQPSTRVNNTGPQTVPQSAPTASADFPSGFVRQLGPEATMTAQAQQPKGQQSQPSQVANFAILPSNYRVDDTRDGWKVGTVDLAFLNASENTLPAREFYLNVNGHQIQTIERKNYEVNVFFSPESPGSAFRRGSGLDGITVERQVVFPIVVGRAGSPITGRSPRLDPAGLPLPPKLPITMVRSIVKREITGDGKIYDTLGIPSNGYFAQFRFAQAASPTRLNLSSPTTSFSIDLLAPGADSPELQPVGLTQRSLLDLSTDIKQVNSNAALDFGQCGRAAGYTDDYSVQYRLANNNNLDELSLKVSHGVWYTNGEYLMSNWQEAGPFLKTGPGQTVTGALRFKNFGVPAYLVIYYSLSDVRTYRLGCK